jgi:anti-sigma factor RsiW
MNDCPNADVRDLLPDLLHGRLDGATRAMVEAHVAGCEDCRAELALLRDLSATMRRGPKLDLAAIAAAVPAYRAPARRSWVGWRTAAAITILVAGGSSVTLMQRNASVAPYAPQAAAPVLAPTTGLPSASTAPVISAPVTTMPSVPATSPAVSAPESIPEAPAPAAGTRPVHELAMSGGALNDLSDRELAALLKDIQSLDAVPTTDVESAAISPLAPRRGGS